jgi:hypothetical protein
MVPGKLYYRKILSPPFWNDSSSADLKDPFSSLLG